MGVSPVDFDVEQQALIWVTWRRGDAIREMERTPSERSPRSDATCVNRADPAAFTREHRVGHLTLVEREEILRGVVTGLPARVIAGCLGGRPRRVARDCSQWRPMRTGHWSPTRRVEWARPQTPNKLAVAPPQMSSVKEEAPCPASPSPTSATSPPSSRATPTTYREIRCSPTGMGVQRGSACRFSPPQDSPRRSVSVVRSALTAKSR
jgi:hypothetical protein